MSTPAVSGAIALWLQANPRLTPQDIMEVFKRTCQRVDDTLDYPNIYYGYGQIDVYKGLLDVLNLSGIEGISMNQPKKVKILPKDDGKVQISFDEAPTTPCWVHVYQTTGAKVRSEKLPSHQDTVLLDIQDLPHGVYVIQVNGQTQETTGSTLVRR